MPTTEPDGRWDPLGQGVRLSHIKTFFPLGFRLEAASDDRLALELVGRAFSRREELFAGEALTMRIVVADAEGCGLPPVYRASGRMLSLAADANHALAADMDAGEAVLWTTHEEMEHAARFARWWIAGPVLQMLSHRALTPVHAACVALDGRGLLLCGPSGAGKSVLALAAAQTGLAFVSDDASYLVRGEPGRVLGRCDLLRLKPSAAGVVNGLEGFATVEDDEAGERVYELDPARDFGMATAGECRVEAVVLLERAMEGPAELSTATSAEATSLLEQTLPLAAEQVAEAQIAGLRGLGALPCWRLRYSTAHEAAQALRKTLSAPAVA
jgi:hypothetical protein